MGAQTPKKTRNQDIVNPQHLNPPAKKQRGPPGEIRKGKTPKGNWLERNCQILKKPSDLKENFPV